MAAEKVLGRHEVEAGGDLGARMRGERASAAIPQRKDEVKIRLQNSSQQKHAPWLLPCVRYHLWCHSYRKRLFGLITPLYTKIL